MCVTWEEPLRVSGCVSVLVRVAVHLCYSVHSVGPSTSPRGVVSPSAWACVSVHPPGSPACTCVDPSPVCSSGCVGTTGGHARCLRVPVPVRVSSPPSLWASCSCRLMCVLQPGSRRPPRLFLTHRSAPPAPDAQAPGLTGLPCGDAPHLTGRPTL